MVRTSSSWRHLVEVAARLGVPEHAGDRVRFEVIDGEGEAALPRRRPIADVDDTDVLWHDEHSRLLETLPGEADRARDDRGRVLLHGLTRRGLTFLP
ncbi:hypothetical protein [Pseudonocardia hydrocarbonoxydans]|uniref:Uncharacterized protein n=1 Tax=Pseudonocardia hydrocarbonoxydans TaxID=76726 RepID=A0A4Y3WVM9_9PSEU|nr:hypothetical protein [Pseudonocardia hydrocarbonoxydans]GEC22937.1 hypothetical protein PHY01_52200 [Pseudonocardia hydrocarbonoxydans]